ncbi:hypothetical protein ACQP0C_14025 [Nocardia sp. CA-129566]|uniref:hypothetical protein n=1 Tax=Nocardia sp. CA-129566 TaxID=3239976 RepID=UPI003D9871F3
MEGRTQPIGPGPLRRDEATRYLCAAVQLDSALATEVVEKVLEEPLRSVARSPGVDLVAVAKHAVAARTRHLVRDLGLVAVLLLVIGNQFVGVEPGAALTYLNIVNPVGLLSKLALFAMVLAWAAVFIEAYAARWGKTAHALRRGVFRAARAPEPQLAAVRDEIEHVAAYADGNVTVYHGYQPFLGHGFPLGAWSMALDITKPKDGDAPIQDFTVTELNERLRKQIAQLDVPNLDVYNRLFVNGNDIHHDRRFLPDPLGRPLDRVAESTIEALMLAPEDRARPYLTTEIIGWDGELAWSGFLRLAASSTSLFVESTYCMVPPLRVAYHEIDELLLRPRPRQLLKLLWRSLLRLPRMWLRAVPNVLYQTLSDVRRRRKLARQHNEISQVFTFDHGALLSIREAASDLRTDKRGRSIGYHRYFQLLDQEMYTKILEKRIFETLAAFLVEKNIDPDELLRRGEQITNNSVTISGDATLLNSSIGAATATTVNAAAGGTAEQ